jgi:hypothetical protein
MYHSILTNTFRQTYLYNRFDYTWQELNVSFQLANDLKKPCLDKRFELTRQELNESFLSDQTSQADILVQVI